MKDRILTSPFDLVVKALNCNKDTVNEDSSIRNHPNWDSLNHLNIIVEMEDSYDVQIPDEEVMKYDNMKSIIELYKSLDRKL